MHIAYLSIGTNLGDRQQNLLSAIDRIGESVGTILRCSSFLETEPWGFESDNAFLNAAVCVGTSLTPHELLAATQRIEREMGRRHKSVNAEYHDRIIDIDILLYDDVTVSTPDLVIPHPLMGKRDFVMIPLREILD